MSHEEPRDRSETDYYWCHWRLVRQCDGQRHWQQAASGTRRVRRALARAGGSWGKGRFPANLARAAKRTLPGMLPGIIAGLILLCAFFLTAGCATSLNRVLSKSNNKSSSTTRSPRASRTAKPSVDQLRVNDESVSAEDLWMFEGKKLGKLRSLGKRDYQTYVERRVTGLITDRVTEMLLHGHAAPRVPPQLEKNIDDYVDGEIRKTITTNYAGVQHTFEKDLATQGLSLEDYRKRVRREVVIQSFLDGQIRPKVVEPTRAELLAIYDANKETWTSPERRRMSLIDVRLDDYLSENADRHGALAEARSVIQAIEVELRNGAEFADLARKHSDGLHAVDGGAWGWVSKDSVRERFEPAVGALHGLDEGEVSGVIATTDGFFLVRCDAVNAAITPTFQQVQPQLLAQHERQTYNRLVTELITDLKQKARIDPPNLDRFREAAVTAAMEKYVSQ